MGRPTVSVVIVGGGITGLATAYYVEQVAKDEGWDLNGVLVEQEPRLGGKLLTLHEAGFLVEGGPDSFLTHKPWALQLIKDLGMEHDLLSSPTRRVFLLHQGQLHSIPQGLVGAVPSRPWELWRASFLSWRGKIRASLEPFIRPRRNGKEESLGAFLRRRLGTEVAQRLAEPFTASIYAGDAQQLSIRDLFPELARWEGDHGSLARGLRAARARSGDAPSASPFSSLRKGMASLPQSIASGLQAFTLHQGKRVEGLTLDKEAERPIYRLSLPGGEFITTDCVILTTPAHSAASLVRSIAPQTAQLLEQLSFASTASVSLAFKHEAIAHSLSGSGFLVPRAEPCPITACTWVSSKWPGRTPAGGVLLRAFVGWMQDSSFMEQDDSALVRQVTDALRPLLGIRGEPEQAWVHRWPQAMPQYQVGHLAWADAVEHTLAGCPGLFLTGASYRGIGVPDCIRQAKETAERIRGLVSQRLLLTHA